MCGEQIIGFQECSVNGLLHILNPTFLCGNSSFSTLASGIKAPGIFYILLFKTFCVWPLYILRNLVRFMETSQEQKIRGLSQILSFPSFRIHEFQVQSWISLFPWSLLTKCREENLLDHTGTGGHLPLFHVSLCVGGMLCFVWLVVLSKRHSERLVC